MLLTALLLLIPSAAPATTWSTVNGELIASTSSYTLKLDATSGAPHALLLNGSTSVTFGADGWWKLTLVDGKSLRAADATALLKRSGDDLRIDYTLPQANVLVKLHLGPKEIELSSTIRAGETAVAGAAIPAQVVFDPAGLKRVSFPFELGRALLPPFFQKQKGESFTGWTAHSIGGKGAVAAGFAPARDHDYNEPPVIASLSEDGNKWLGPIAGELQGWRVRCPRAPQGDQETTLLDTPSGPLLSLQTVDGGWGRVIRWGGVFEQDDTSRVIAASVQTALSLWNSPISAGKTVAPPAASLGKPRKDILPARVGFFDLGDAPSSGAWRSVLARLGGTLVTIASPSDLGKHLKDRDCWLIVNPYGELLPATETDAPQMAAAIRRYVTNGGVWLHTGGYPFFTVIEPPQYLRITQTYPPAFSDFIHLSLNSGELSVYGVQSRKEIFTPVDLGAGGTDAGGVISRSWITWIDPGKSRTMPLTRLHVGENAETSILQYGVANGFTRPLADKVPAATLPLLKRSLLVRYGEANCKQMLEGLDLLPKPSLVHIAEYLHGGFDKQYPDHLPPNSWFGTEAEFSSFVQAIHASGRLFMPYTNPTWWCDGPPGPSLVREGNAPLLKDRKGNPVKEIYAKNYGWSLCAFHPAALAAEQTILKQFTQQYPVDVLFQDQVGARSPQYDFNPASPTPSAYIQGMMDIARRDSKSAPLSTENGFDGILNDETQFCGITWGLVPTEGGPDWRGLWRDRFPENAWSFTPLALWLAHDKILFDHHDLGQFVTNKETLAWTLALGYQLSVRTNPFALKDPVQRRWIDWLAEIQSTFGLELMGAPLVSWQEPVRGVYRAHYGNVEVISNTTPQPYRIDDQNTLSAYGFSLVCAKSGLSAGWFDRLKGKDYSEGGYAFVQHGTQLSIYTAARPKQ